MTRYVNDTNITVKQGQDAAFQVWVTDNRNESVPFTIPAKMTVKDKVGQIVLETTDESTAAGTEAMVLTSPVNGLVQVTIPRAVTVDIPPGTYIYDVWATIVDIETAAMFPDGQQVPVISGRLTVTARTTVMEDVTP